MIPNKITVGGQDVELTGGTQIELSRGVEPSYATFYIADPTMFDGITNPVTIRIETPKAEDMQVAAVLELHNWHIISITPQDTGLYKMVLADNRFIAKYPKLNKSFNIKTIDGVYRITSVKNGVSYTIAEALEIMWKDYGLSMRVDPRCPKLANPLAFLPTNLGNSEGGGYFAETISAALPPILERARASFVLDRNGTPMLTDRVTDCTAGLIDRGAYEGLIAPRDIHWQIPDEIHVLFQQRFERCFELIEDSQSTAPPLNDYEFKIENVVGVPTAPSAISNPIDFITFNPGFLGLIGFSFTKWKERYFKETVIPETGRTMAEQLRLERLGEYGKEHWRLLYRVKFTPTRNRIWTNLKMGRLGYDGNSSRASYVFMDYTAIREFPRFDRTGSRITAKFSQEFVFPTDLSVLDIIDSPFTADFVTSGKDDLLFRVQPLSSNLKFERLYPCLLETQSDYTDAQDFVNDVEQANVIHRLVPKEKFKIRVYFHALLSDDGPTARYHVIKNGTKKTSTKPGTGLILTVRSDAVTANWTMRSNREPVMLNEVTLIQEAKDITARLEQAYADAKAGFLACVGIECLTDDKNWVGGNINRVVIRVGMDPAAPYTVTTLFEVLPEVTELLGDVRTDTGAIATAGVAPELVS